MMCGDLEPPAHIERSGKNAEELMERASMCLRLPPCLLIAFVLKDSVEGLALLLGELVINENIALEKPLIAEWILTWIWLNAGFSALFVIAVVWPFGYAVFPFIRTRPTAAGRFFAEYLLFLFGEIVVIGLYIISVAHYQLH